MELLNELFLQLLGLAGFAAAVSLVINILKTVGIVKDGTAGMWSAGFNLAGLIALYVARIIKPGLDVVGVDKDILSFVNAVSPLIEYILMLLSSRLAHSGLRGIPIVGKSFTAEG